MTSVVSIVVANFGTKFDTISIDTEYGRIIIEDIQYDEDGIRYYRQSGAYSSATYLDEERKFELVFDYLKKYDMAQHTNIRNILSRIIQT